MTPRPAGDEVYGRVHAWLDAWRSLNPLDSPIGVAVSGGGDSVALLYIASQWARNIGAQLHVLTVDHGLRRESGSEAAFVAGLAQRLEWPVDVLRWEGGDGSARKARMARHSLLANACRQNGLKRLLLGHTLDDQFETFLMRARQGSGWYGLGGMDRMAPSPVWPEGEGLALVRPILNQRRSEIRHWLSVGGHSWVDDPTNEDMAYERVRMRRLIAGQPEIAGQLGRILPLLGTLRRAEQLAMVDAIKTRVTHMSNGRLEFDPTGLSEARAVRLLGWLVQVAAGRAAMPRESMLTEAYRALVVGDKTARTLAGAWLVMKPGGVISISQDRGKTDRDQTDLSRSIGPRLAHICLIWRQLPSLSHATRQ